jgi:glycosyltransferase involved in cell wall biosynthesis
VLDVLVACHPHSEELSYFPEVRGFYLAKHLGRLGLKARFAQFPAPGVRCRALICSEYQQEMDWFEEYLAGPISDIDAERMFCLIAYPLGRQEHFSSDYCEWFAQRGGVLCHLDDGEFGAYEHWIGLGVDAEVVRPGRPDGRDTVVFDFPFGAFKDPFGAVKDPASAFDPAWVEALRRRSPAYRIVGTGRPDAPIRHLFDEWVPYGLSHATYVAMLYERAVALVVGAYESMGLGIAEAQVAGACVLATEGQVRSCMLCADAGIYYDGSDPSSLAAAVTEAATRDHGLIRRRACEQFDFARVAERTRAATGL